MERISNFKLKCGYLRQVGSPECGMRLPAGRQGVRVAESEEEDEEMRISGHQGIGRTGDEETSMNAEKAAEIFEFKEFL